MSDNILEATDTPGATHVRDILAHYGKKGMKWGVRTGERGKIRRGLTKANVALDAGAEVINRGEKKLIFLPHEKRQDAATATQHRVLGEAAAVNRDPRFKGKDLKKDPELKKAYSQEIEKRALTIYKDELNLARVDATLDAVNAVMDARNSRLDITAPRDRVRHEDGGQDVEVLLRLNFTTDDLGHIVAVEIDPESLAHSDVDRFLAHYGKKGMKWGVRTDKGHEGQRVTTKKLEKLDKKWEKSIYTQKGAVAIHNNVARQMNDSVISKLNNDPKYKDKNLYDDPELEKAYFKDYTSQVSQAYSRAVTQVHGSSPSGKKEAFYRPETENLEARIDIRDKNVSHAESEDNEPDLVFFLRKNATGHVIEFNGASSDVSHGEDFVKNYLAHYGVPGMKWGKTKSEGPTPVTTVATPGRRVQATGGTNQPAHPDAIKTAAAKRKAKASTVDSLSNEELQNLVKRIQLEQQFSKLTYQPSKLKKGYNFISGAVGVGRTVNEVMAFQNSPAGKQLDDAFKKQKNKNRGEEE